MADITTTLSEKENQLVQRYADENGLDPEAALKELAIKNLEGRVKFKRQRKMGEVRTFESPKNDRGGLKSD